MTLQAFIAKQTANFADAGIASARLDVLLLLEHAFGQDRAHLLAYPDREIPSPVLAKLNNKCMQRMRHLPLSYLTNETHFYGRTYYVDEYVLVPRPESERIISLLLDLDIPAGTRIADIGTGSGCLGITAALELHDMRVTLCDKSHGALLVAQRNAKALGAACSFAETDLLEGCPLPQDILLANLPYVPDTYPINKAASHEPRLALFAGKDGLDMYRLMFQQIDKLSEKPTHIITEALLEQHGTLKALAAAHGYVEVAIDGLAQHFILS